MEYIEKLKFKGLHQKFAAEFSEIHHMVIGKNLTFEEMKSVLGLKDSEHPEKLFLFPADSHESVDINVTLKNILKLNERPDNFTDFFTMRTNLTTDTTKTKN